MDSTVLLDLARRVDPNVPAVFLNTGLEFPENFQFVQSAEHVVVLQPAKNFVEVVNEYGYPVISKEVANTIEGARKGQRSRLLKINGEFLDKDGNKSIFNYEKYKYLMDADFAISGHCCDCLKKRPFERFEKRTGMKGFDGTMAGESHLRMQVWLRNGCNAFAAHHPISRPMSFWTRQDILQYIYKFNLPYSKAYGKITLAGNQQISLFPTELILETTGEQRTGCMFCLFGVHLEKEPNRFQRMKKRTSRREPKEARNRGSLSKNQAVFENL